MNIFINKSEWQLFTKEEMIEYKKEVFNHYRSNGFPYFNLPIKDRFDIFNKLKYFESNSLLQEDNVIKQLMLGLNLANYYMPNMWSVKSNGFVSPMETYLDDEKFKKAIDKRIKLGDNISDAGIRKALCWSNSSQRVSNFRPTVAKYIYDNYANNGDVLDFSCGYGGRLLGAVTSEKVLSYNGFEPCTETYDNLLKFNKALDHIIPVNIYNLPFEDSNLEKDRYSLAFSSPPYFSQEIYSNEDTQSCNRYKTKEEWKEKFLKVLIDKCYYSIKKDGYFIINIANVKSYKELEKDTLDLSEKIGFNYIKTYKMSLSALMKKGFKYEPIFVFKK